MHSGMHDVNLLTYLLTYLPRVFVLFLIFWKALNGILWGYT